MNLGNHWYRDHLQYHPFICFELPYADASPGLWELLGRCVSLFELIAKAPLKPALAEQLYRVSLSKYIEGTSAIEGIHHSPEVVERLVRATEAGPPEYTEAEIASFVRVVDAIRHNEGAGESKPVSEAYLGGLNRAALEGAPPQPGLNIGHLRHHAVTVHGYGPPGPDHLDALVRDLCLWINEPHASGLPQQGLRPLGQCLFKAISAHLYFEMIHPFGDGNGRVGRLLELDLLVRGGVPLPAALGLTSHYNEHKTRYFEAIRGAEKSPEGEGFFAFVMFALEGLYAKSRDMVKRIQQQTLDALWKDYVYERTDELKRRAAGRRQQLLALSLDVQPLLNRRIREINPQVAVAYHEKTDAILIRDLKALQALGLVVRTKEGWKANKQSMRAFEID